MSQRMIPASISSMTATTMPAGSMRRPWDSMTLTPHSTLSSWERRPITAARLSVSTFHQSERLQYAAHAHDLLLEEGGEFVGAHIGVVPALLLELRLPGF